MATARPLHRPATGHFDSEKIEAAVRLIFEAVGLETDGTSLEETPARVARMYEELFSGIGVDPRSVIDIGFDENHDDLVVVRDISFASVCEHHLLPFLGHAHIAYLPGESGRVTGLSKLARVVDVAARRPGLQERMTATIADSLVDALEPKGVIVVVEAEHTCMSVRGVQKPGTLTITSAVRGIMRSDARTRAEALAFINRGAPR